MKIEEISDAANICVLAGEFRFLGKSFRNFFFEILYYQRDDRQIKLISIVWIVDL